MTLVEIGFQLQAPLTSTQLQSLAEFANTYGLRKFRVDASGQAIRFEYDASRLRATQVAHLLRQARIPVADGLA